MNIATEIQRLQQAKADIKSAIEEKGVTVGDGTIDTYAEKIGEIQGGGSGDYEQGYEDGKNSVVPFERYADNIRFTNLNVFNTEKAEINLDSATNLGEFCYVKNAENVNTTVKELTINCPNLVTSILLIVSCRYPAADNILKKIVLNLDTSKCTNFSYAFNYLKALETIDGQPLDFGAISNVNSMLNVFVGCITLKSFRVVANSIKYNFNIGNSSLLDAETIQSIIDGLADLTGSTAQTLTLHATVGGKLTDEQKATITAKNWTLVY